MIKILKMEFFFNNHNRNKKFKAPREIDELPKLVSAVKECFVPRFDSKINPGKSSLSIVACCCPSLLWIDNSLSFLLDNAQLPTTSLVAPGRERIGWLTEFGFTWLRALCSFSKNSPRFSKKKFNNSLKYKYILHINKIQANNPSNHLFFNSQLWI